MTYNFLATVQQASSSTPAVQTNRTGILSVQGDSFMNTSARSRPPSISVLPLPSRVMKVDLRQFLPKNNQPPPTGQPASSTGHPFQKSASRPITTISTTQTK